MLEVNNTRKKDREAWLDILKAFAIICVVIGHVLKGNIQASMYSDTVLKQEFVMDFIYSFHMPLFFTLSGYTYFKYIFCEKRNTSHIKWSVINLTLIYCIFQVSICVLKAIFPALVNNPVMLKDVASNVFFPTSPMWYIYIMIYYYILFAFTKSRLNNGKNVLLVLLLLLLTGVGFKYLLNILNAPSCVVRFFYYLQFFWSGNCLKYIENNRRINNLIFDHKAGSICISSIPVIIYIVFLIFGMDNSLLKLFCSYGVIIDSYITAKSISGDLKAFRYIGENSLIIYLLHTYFVTANRYFFKTSQVGNVYVEVLAGILLGIFAPLLINPILEHVPFIKRILLQPGKCLHNICEGKKSKQKQE